MAMLRPLVGGDTNSTFANLFDDGQGPTGLSNYDLRNLLNDDNDDSSDAPEILKNQSCQYFEPEEVHTQIDSNSFSILSHNIRSLSGHFESFKDMLYTMLPANFSVIALQEVWSIYKTYNLTGYSNVVFKTRDMNKERNPNCGGGVGFFVNKKFEYEVLEEE